MSAVRKFKNLFFFLLLFNYLGNPLSANLENKKTSKVDNYKTEIGEDYLRNLPNYDYLLGPGDLIEVNISMNYPELKTRSVIDSEGTIYLPSLNRIYVKGLTINELSQLLNKSLEKYVKFPNVEIKIIEYRRINIYTIGEIKDPGLHVFEGSLNLDASNSDEIQTANYTFFPTIFDAIRTSDGFTRNADFTKIELVRQNSISRGGGKIKTTLNFEKFLEGDMSQNIRIYDGDTIIVKKSLERNSKSLDIALKTNINPKYIEVFVQGSVTQPGLIRLPSQSSLNQAILLAGGIKVLNGPITHITFLSDGTYKTRKIRYRKNAKPGSAFNPYLNSKDIVFVNQGNIVKSNEFIQIITSPFINVISSYGLYKALSD